ncbi:MAG TPA: response regulator [Bacteroidales bacterium]|nr:response regulator [Bacteroidales bacterium]
MHPISILVVEDEKVQLTVITHLLRSMAATVLEAGDGAAGLEMYIKHQPDLVITDIRMPMMSGLDMTARICAINPKARVILLSAYSESQYFLRAIELGVKSYLLKPIAEERLRRVVDEQAYDILLEQKIQSEEHKRREAENTLLRNEQLLQSVSEVAELMLLSAFGSNPLPQALEILGKASNVSRVYIFENFIRDGNTFSRQTYEWTAQGIGSELNNPELQDLPHTDSSFERWAGLLSKGEPVYGLVREMPLNEQAVLVPQGIIAVMSVPIFVRGRWHGFLGFDECLYERHWSPSELSSLLTAGNIIGAAIERQSTEKELIQLNKTLEERVRQRTQKLQVEVNERKMAEQLLRQSEEKYRLVFENANDGIVLSISGIIAFINPRYFELTGYLPNLLIGKSLTHIVAPEYRSLLEQQLQKAEAGERYVQHVDAELITASGHRHWVEIKFNSVQWDDEPAVLIFIADIHQRKIYESELRDLNTNLELRVQEVLKHREQQQQKIMHKSRLESLGELATGIAHEINQPIGGLSMSLDNILDELHGGSLSDDYLEQKINTMFADIERVRQIINHVRIFARDQDPVLRKPFALNEVISNTMKLIERSYANNNIQLTATPANPDVMLYGNPMRLEQVLLNLFSNAKYAVEQKRNRNSYGYQPSININCSANNETATIIITDNGTGIPDDILDSVFHPFFTSKKADEGTGLGLSISYGIIAEMHGTIEVETLVDEYTSMIIRLPVHHSNSKD